MKKKIVRSNTHRNLVSKRLAHPQLPADLLCAPFMVKPRTGFQLAQNPLEQSAAIFLQRIGVSISTALIDPRQREFYFRCHLVPRFCQVVIGFVSEHQGGSKYWLHQHGGYVLAWERMALEFLLRTRKHISGAQLVDAMLNSREGAAYWMRRFEQLRSAAKQSYTHFIAKKFPDVKNLEGEQARAAHLGALEKISEGLPEKLFSDTLARFKSDKSLLKTFAQNSKRKREGRWGDPELDTWLIEVWPLVTEYGWNYHDVWQVACAKWDVDIDDNSLDSVSRVSDRCKKMLGLRLATAGQAKQGKPAGVAEGKKMLLPPLAALAIGLESLGCAEELWVQGQFSQ